MIFHKEAQVATRKSPSNIHDVRIQSGESVLNVVVCAWHNAILKMRLDKAENIISEIPAIGSECEACNRQAVA